MSEDFARRVHELDATVRVGKRGIEAVEDELATQLDNTELVKVKFLRSARGSQETAELAATLGEAAGAEVVETRGNTAVYRR